MTGRRAFLRAAIAGGAVLLPRAVRGDAVTVTARATPFRGHPEGRTTLVRFVVTGADQPAGRLRVFDARGQLAGTAGVLRSGDALVGELWLPLTGETRLRTELEMPGTRGPIRSSHVVRPRDRWTLHWITLASADALGELLAPLPLLARSARVLRLDAAGVRVNPAPEAPDPLVLDHMALARLAVPAVRAAQRWGLPVADLARHAELLGLPFAPLALADAGVQTIATPDAAPSLLGLGRSRTEAARQLEAMLPADTGGARDRTFLVVGHELGQLDRARAFLDDWNAAYAYPRIVTTAPATGSITVPDARLAPAGTVVPDPGRIQAVRDARTALAAARTREAFAPFASLVAPRDATLDAVARVAALPLGGVLVFNPGPFTRSGPVEVDGAVRGFATDVPAFGYAWLPELSAAPPRGARPAAELDDATGDVRSLHDGTGGPEWAGAGGLNALGESWLDGITPGPDGATVVRRVTYRGAVTTTVHAGGGALTIVNDADVVGSDPFPYRFSLAGPVRQVRWDTPGGVLSAAPPVAPAAVHRWIACDTEAGTLVLVTPDAPWVEVDGDGTLTVQATAGRTRLLLAPRPPYVEVDPWRLAGELDPLPGYPTAGNGPEPIPTFGRLVGVDEAGVIVAGIKPADDGVGVIVYLQELLGVPREVPLEPGVLRFAAAFHCDLAERDRAALAVESAGAIRVPLPARGFAAVRLLGVTVARG